MLPERGETGRPEQTLLRACATFAFMRELGAHWRHLEKSGRDARGGALALMLCLAGCSENPQSGTGPPRSGAASEVALVRSVPDPGCGSGSDEGPKLDVDAVDTTLKLSLAKFGSDGGTGGAGLASWAMSPTAVSSSCRTVGTAEPRTGFYRGGGFQQTFCQYTIGGRGAAADKELAAALAPIDSPRKALGIVALRYVVAYGPELASPKPEKKVRMPKEVADRGVEAFDVDRFDGGYIVRVPEESSCPRSVRRRAYRVATDGSVCAAKEAPVLLDVRDGACSD